jgi:hypothetical protein
MHPCNVRCCLTEMPAACPSPDSAQTEAPSWRTTSQATAPGACVCYSEGSGGLRSCTRHERRSRPPVSLRDRAKRWPSLPLAESAARESPSARKQGGAVACRGSALHRTSTALAAFIRPRLRLRRRLRQAARRLTQLRIGGAVCVWGVWWWWWWWCGGGGGGQVSMESWRLQVQPQLGAPKPNAAAGKEECSRVKSFATTAGTFLV